MKLVTQLRLAILLILGLGLCSVALMLWHFQQSEKHIQRINIAQSIYGRYLNLESHTYQLFKQYGDAIIIGDANQRESKNKLIATIKSDFRIISESIALKAELVEGSRAAEAEKLKKIQQTVDGLIRSLDQFSPTGTGELASDWNKLSELLNAEIDQNFRGLIQDALDEQERNVLTTTLSVEKAVLQQQITAGVLAVLAIIAAIAGIMMLSRRFTHPINTLVAGVREFGDGRLEYRINLKGNDEIAEIGKTFDTMAAQIAEKNRALTDEKRILQEAVDERTMQLSHMLEDVKRIDASRKRMIADVSHELRTPLTIIKGEADIALRGDKKPASVYIQALGRTREAANHTARLVDDLLFVARTEAGEVRLNMDDLNLYTLSLDAQQTFARDSKFITTLASAPMRGDALRIQQAILVLLENAKRYGGNNIELHLEKSDGGFTLSVEDDGPGMDDETKGQAFERFFRGSNAAERYRDGAGLGIPVAYSIAQAHGGTIELSDREGGGLVAALLLPSVPLLENVA